MYSPAQDIACRLARNAAAVCKYYLSNGTRRGSYWVVGAVDNSEGNSLYVRLVGPDSGKGAAGKWTDAATLEHGDLLDLIGRRLGLCRLRDQLEEARLFLSLPPSAVRDPDPDHPGPHAGASDSPVKARRLFRMSRTIGGTLVETYLRGRGITELQGLDALRFHPTCYYRPHPKLPTQTWPAMIAAVTDLAGQLQGVHRTWLDPSGLGKAPLLEPRRAMGLLLGNAVRFGVAADVMIAGEGIETVASLRPVLPAMPMAAALSAAHLAALILPPWLKRLYIAQDPDAAGAGAAVALTARGRAAGTEVLQLLPIDGDFNDDLRFAGTDAHRGNVLSQLDPADALRFQRRPIADT